MKCGQFVLTFRGRHITFEETKVSPIECYCVQVGTNDYLDTEAPERFINHSCDPNCGFREADTLVAVRDIAEGEELTFDYSTSMDENSWTLDCRCRSFICRGVIRDFRMLPFAWQTRYLAMGVVPSWLKERLVETMPLLTLARASRSARRRRAM